jgi:hypothetical protein
VSAAKHTPGQFVIVRISPTISNEYANRCPEGIPEEAFLTGKRSVSLQSARAMLSDAEYNSDKTAFDVGPDDMPLGTFNAYRALAKQLRVAIAKATGSAE